MLPVIIVVVQQGEKGIVQLFSFLVGVEVFPFPEIVRIGQLVKGKDVKSGDPFVALDSDPHILRFRDLLDGEVVSNPSCPIPDVFVDSGQPFIPSNDPVEEIVERSPESVRGSYVRGELFVVSSGRSPKSLYHTILRRQVFARVIIVDLTPGQHHPALVPEGCIQTSHLLSFVDHVLYDALNSFERRTHVCARSHRGDGIVETCFLVGIGEEPIANGLGALSFSFLFELDVDPMCQTPVMQSPRSARRSRNGDVPR